VSAAECNAAATVIQYDVWLAHAHASFFLFVVRLVLDIFGWARLAFRPDCITVEYRDVNSREIAFPGRESQFPGLDQDSISPDYVLFAGVIGVGSLAGA